MSEAQDRQARLKAALRANLRRRKAGGAPAHMADERGRRAPSGGCAAERDGTDGAADDD